MSEVINEAMPNIQGRLVHYTMQNGTEVTQQRFYEVSPESKWRQVRNADVRGIFAENVANSLAPVSAQAAPAAASTPEASVTPIIIEKKKWRDRLQNSKLVKSAAAVIAFATLAGGIGTLAANNPDADGREMAPVAAPARAEDILPGEARVPEPIGTALINNSGALNTSGNFSSFGDHNWTEKLTAKNHEETKLESAIDSKLSAIGLKAGQFETITDVNAELGGPIETGHFSMNHSAEAWNNYHRSTDGAKLMGQDILSGKNGFTASDAEVAQNALRHFNVPQNVIDKLAKGDYSDITIKTVTVNGPVYHNIAFNNNGTLAIDEMRANIGEKDAFFVIGYKNGDNYEAVATRADCGGVGPQPFESVTVLTPPTPEQPKLEEKKEEKKEEKREKTTTTTAPAVTTTAPVQETTSTTVDSSTTSTTRATTSTTDATTPTTDQPITPTTGRPTTTRPEVTVPVPPPIQGPGAGGEPDRDNNPDNNVTTTIERRPTTSVTASPNTTGTVAPGPGATVTTEAPPANDSPAPSVLTASFKELPTPKSPEKGETLPLGFAASVLAAAGLAGYILNRKIRIKVGSSR